MTAPTVDAVLRPLPWRRMAWVTWRQHRIAVAGVLAVLGALAVYLVATGLPMHHAWDAVAVCHPAASSACAAMRNDFNSEYVPHAVAAVVMMQLAPALTGAFTGAPVLARELETGTFRYAWTQGIGRWRWTIGKLVPLATVLTACAGACSALFSWYYEPFLAENFQTPLAPVLFGLRGVAFVGWMLAAFSIGALAGMLIRRVMPAVVVTLAAYAGLALAAGTFLRQHYLTPLVSKSPDVSGAAWIIKQWYTKDGVVAFAGVQKSGVNFTRLQHFCPSAPPSETLGQCLSHLGYTQWTSYQPASRFWPFQWIEGGWLLVLSLLLVAATLWLVRRRAA